MLALAGTFFFSTSEVFRRCGQRYALVCADLFRDFPAAGGTLSTLFFFNTLLFSGQSSSLTATRVLSLSDCLSLSLPSFPSMAKPRVLCSFPSNTAYNVRRSRSAQGLLQSTRRDQEDDDLWNPTMPILQQDWALDVRVSRRRGGEKGRDSSFPDDVPVFAS